MQRTQAIDLIIAERLYQTEKWGSIDAHPQALPGYLTLVRKEAEEALDGWTKNKTGRNDPLAELVQVAALCVAALEQHGNGEVLMDILEAGFRKLKAQRFEDVTKSLRQQVAEAQGLLYTRPDCGAELEAPQSRVAEQGLVALQVGSPVGIISGHAVGHTGEVLKIKAGICWVRLDDTPVETIVHVPDTALEVLR